MIFLQQILFLLMFLDLLERRLFRENEHICAFLQKVFSEEVLISYSLYAIQLYSIAQLNIQQFLSTYPQLTLFMHGFMHSFETPVQVDANELYVKNAIVVDNTANGYDFKVVTYDNGQKRIYYANEQEHANCEECDFRFFLMEFEYKNTKYEIQLESHKPKRYNYYVVNNQFDKNFFLFYLYHYYRVQDIDTTAECKLTILDHNVEHQTFHFTTNDPPILLFTKENYVHKNK